MPKHSKSTTITAVLMAERDRLKMMENEFRQKAKDVMDQAKATSHQLKIEANQLAAKILVIQECITLEMQQDYVEQQRIDEDYKYHKDYVADLPKEEVE